MSTSVKVRIPISQLFNAVFYSQMFAYTARELWNLSPVVLIFYLKYCSWYSIYSPCILNIKLSVLCATLILYTKSSRVKLYKKNCLHFKFIWTLSIWLNSSESSSIEHFETVIWAKPVPVLIVQPTRIINVLFMQS